MKPISGTAYGGRQLLTGLFLLLLRVTENDTETNDSFPKS